jgi:predicted transcriptional regulator
MDNLEFEEKNELLVSLTADVVSAYVSNHEVPSDDLTNLISNVHLAFGQLYSAKRSQDFEKQNPAVPIKKSIARDYLICLEDGKKFKSLKRHLKTHYNLSPAEYREKWGLPADYPMVAPAYAEARSQLAKQMGLGHRRRRSA